MSASLVGLDWRQISHGVGDVGGDAGVPHLFGLGTRDSDALSCAARQPVDDVLEVRQSGQAHSRSLYNKYKHVAAAAPNDDDFANSAGRETLLFVVLRACVLQASADVRERGTSVFRRSRYETYPMEHSSTIVRRSATHVEAHNLSTVCPHVTSCRTC